MRDGMPAQPQMTRRLCLASRRPYVEPVVIWVSLEQQTPRVPIRKGPAMGRAPGGSYDRPVRRLQPADPPLEIAALLAQRCMVAGVPSFQLALPMGGHLVLSPRKIRQPRDLHGVQPGPRCASRQPQRHAKNPNAVPLTAPDANRHRTGKSDLAIVKMGDDGLLLSFRRAPAAAGSENLGDDLANRLLGHPPTTRSISRYWRRYATGQAHREERATRTPSN